MRNSPLAGTSTGSKGTFAEMSILPKCQCQNVSCLNTRRRNKSTPESLQNTMLKTSQLQKLYNISADAMHGSGRQ